MHTHDRERARARAREREREREREKPAERRECGDDFDENHHKATSQSYITRKLLAGALGKDGGLGHVEVKPGILLEDVLEISQDLERNVLSSHA
jgi:hypothetical protein